MSMKTKTPVEATPGPWEATEERNIMDGTLLFHTIRDAEGNYILSTWGDPHLGNALVSAAAPDLLAACEVAVADAVGASNPSARLPNFKQIQAAIAKAKGTA